MIDIKELCIGSLVSFCDRPFIIMTPDDLKSFYLYKPYTFDEFAKYLKLSGFIKNPGILYYYEKDIQNNHILYVQYGTEKLNAYNNVIDFQCRYVHRLQMLYYSLTGLHIVIPEEMIKESENNHINKVRDEIKYNKVRIVKEII